MLMVFPSGENGSLQSILTRRKDSLNHHPGQISLPGGRRDEGETLDEAARREVEEEVGVERSAMEILGTLNPIYIPPSDFTVTPFVGWLPGEPEFELEPEEVAELIHVPLTLLLDPTIRQVSSVSSDARDREVPWFSIEGHQVWGATAMILDDFAQRMRKETSD
jgi:8-oxo-dGTP pyrophosphatase MutT (NUDIX family)